MSATGQVRTIGVALLLIYVGSVVLANYLTVHDGLISIGFGLMCTAGTVAVGGAILTRDFLQDALGRVVVLSAIGVGALLSWVVADAHIAAASGLTFLIAETLEFVVYTPLRQRVGFATPRWSGVVAVANLTGAIADTFLFLWLAGFPITRDVVGGQMLGKLYLTVVVIMLAPLVKASIRRPVST